MCALVSALVVRTSSHSGRAATSARWLASLTARPSEWPRCPGRTNVMPTDPWWSWHGRRSGRSSRRAPRRGDRRRGEAAVAIGDALLVLHVPLRGPLAVLESEVAGRHHAHEDAEGARHVGDELRRRDAVPLDDPVAATTLRRVALQRLPVRVVAQVEDLEALGVGHLVAVRRGEPGPGARSTYWLERVPDPVRAAPGARQLLRAGEQRRPRRRARGGPAGRRCRRRRGACCRAAGAGRHRCRPWRSPRTPPAA